MANKLFLSQQAIDGWISKDLVEVQGPELTVRKDGRRLKLVGAAHFSKVSGDGPDPAGLVGKVKDEQGLAKLGAEQYMNSVILGETAYDVAPGFVATPVADKDGQGLVAAIRALG